MGDGFTSLRVWGNDLRPYGFVGQFDILRPVGKVTVCLILTSSIFQVLLYCCYCISFQSI